MSRRARAWTGGIATSAALAALFAAAGALFSAEEVPGYGDSPEQITGMALMLIVLPGYLIVAGSIATDRSLTLIEELRGRLPEPGLADRALERVRGAPRRTWVVGLVAGILMGLVNTNPWRAVQSEAARIAVPISMGQILLWSLVGLLLARRIASAGAFRELGRVVEIDLLRPDSLRPLARAGMIDVVIIAVALAFTPLQSLDAEFRWYNYRFGLLVALPSSAFLLLWPLQTAHQRMLAARDAALAAVDAALAAHPEARADPELLVRLEGLLAHRDRLQGLRTWPLSSALLSRVFLYLVIPPLAWAGAAVVERVVDRLLAG